ncbi:ATP-dependent bile acid permease [Plectosphaerella plurivora]|uniref:ATP-dependent bile acid permease n=1 Tax=Plectosphaerella plurivora TaxID=936078 RepID=A0A9P8VB38_9PEZI|nr:ATP-dependent bile acid permease [Plectosphaerella plurivora]
MAPDLQLVEAAIGLGAIGLSSIPGILALLRQIRHRKPRDNFYEDKDGKSRPEDIAAFSNRWQKFAVALVTALGLGSSLAASFLITPQDNDNTLILGNWLLTGSWIFLTLQAVCITAMHSSVEAYNLGLWAWFSSLILGLVTLLQDPSNLVHLYKHNLPSFVLKIVNLVAVLSLFFTSVSLPRRPNVYRNGRIVDRMFTDTAFSRYNWSWGTDLMAYAKKTGDLKTEDLARPNSHTSSADNAAIWNAKFKDTKMASHWSLWGRIIWYYRWSFSVQWFVALTRNFLAMAPFWVTLQILRALEIRQPGESLSVDIWVMVFWLGFTIAADAWVTTCLFWLSWCEVLVPLRGLLSALIVEKAMRRKNVKATASKSPLDLAKDTDDKKPDAEEEEDDDADALKSQQGIVNLIGVDAKRISDFAAFQFFIPGSFARLAVAIWFLISLLGWIPVFGGLATWGIILPLNIYYTKLYSAAQDRLMKVRDQKLAVVNESLQGMRQIKFSALEVQWEKKILGMREKELSATWDVFKSDTLLFGSWIVTPIALASASLVIYAIIHRELTPSVAFVSISVFKALELALSLVPELITDMIDANVSVRRMFEYFNTPEIENNIFEGPDVAFEGADLAWPAEEDTAEADRFVIRNVNLTFPTGELSIISGPTGSGKSLLLASILGETDLLSGKIYAPKAPSLTERRDKAANPSNWIIPESIAFISQIPWIENATLKDNILFGLPLDEERFNDVIKACALEKDLQMLSDGERTELGANGVNLSGGQKWRVTLARAVYSRAGILIMDDIFSAVDTHVGRHIFEKCLTGPLCRGRTRILVTHHVALVESKAKFIAELGNGTVLHSGFLSELDEDGTLELIKSHEPLQSKGDSVDDDRTAVNSEQTSQLAVPQTIDEEDLDGGVIKKVPSRAARQFVEEETREQGAIKVHVYSAYLRDSGGWAWWIFALFLFTGFQALTLGRSWWLRIWTNDTSGNHSNNFTTSQLAYTPDLQHVVNIMSPTPTTDVGIMKESYSLNFYLGIYVLISVLTAIGGTVRFGYMFLMSIKASRRLFENMTYSILRTPLRWIDTVPTGRVLNRFTADFNIIDSRLAIDLTTTASNVLGIIGICVAAMFVSPYIIVLALVLLSCCAWIASFYLAAARPAKRLESTTKSPIFELFGSSLSGVTTIRGFDKATHYVDAMYEKLDDYGMATYHLWLYNRWMGWKMNIVGSLFAVVVAAMVLSNSQMDAALAGFTLSFALEFSDAVLWTIRNYANIELDMNAAERVVEYSELPTENQGGQDPPAAWPTEGRLEVDNLVVTYASDLPPVLKGVSFSVDKNQRVGVVGRTGAGKSSLTLALFRFLEAQAGSIHIDGLDISKIKLQQLRSRLAIIPQDPVLFSGTVRSNLDPFDERTDDELRDSLQRVHLVGSVPGTPGEPSGSSSATAVATNTNPFSSLSSPISEGGLNLSQGQRQLLCLARAIVARPKVMVLDEATSAVDMATDALIQRSIREEFTGSTLIVIAHRLSTIADFDRILVLSEGTVAEYGSPQELWQKGTDGVFRSMCDESGEKEKLRRVIFGEE